MMLCKICGEVMLAENAYYHQCNLEKRLKAAALRRAGREMEMTQNERDALYAKRARREAEK